MYVSENGIDAHQSNAKNHTAINRTVLSDDLLQLDCTTSTDRYNYANDNSSRTVSIVSCLRNKIFFLDLFSVLSAQLRQKDKLIDQPKMLIQNLQKPLLNAAQLNCQQNTVLSLSSPRLSALSPQN